MDTFFLQRSVVFLNVIKGQRIWKVDEFGEDSWSSGLCGFLSRLVREVRWRVVSGRYRLLVFVGGLFLACSSVEEYSCLQHSWNAPHVAFPTVEDSFSRECFGEAKDCPASFSFSNLSSSQIFVEANQRNFNSSRQDATWPGSLPRTTWWQTLTSANSSWYCCKPVEASTCREFWVEQLQAALRSSLNFAILRTTRVSFIFYTVLDTRFRPLLDLTLLNEATSWICSRRVIWHDFISDYYRYQSRAHLQSRKLHRVDEIRRNRTLWEYEKYAEGQIQNLR